MPQILLEGVLSIELTDWEKGSKHSNLLIQEIIQNVSTREERDRIETKDLNISEEVLNEEEQCDFTIETLLSATLFDFSFDELNFVMHAIPMPEDWKHLNDPQILAAFLEDAGEVREGFEMLCSALKAEGTTMQGAGAANVYFSAVLSEFEKADQVGKLRVGKLLEYGSLLEGMAQNEHVQAEFGVLNPTLEMNVRNLRELMRKYFSDTLARFAVLRDLELEDDANAWDVLKTFRDIVAEVKTGSDGVLPPLVKGDAAVLVDMLDSIERLLVSIDASSNTKSVSAMQREANFQLAKVGATVGIYREKAASAVGKTADGADASLKWFKRIKGIKDFADILQKAWDAMF